MGRRRSEDGETDDTVIDVVDDPTPAEVVAKPKRLTDVERSALTKLVQDAKINSSRLWKEVGPTVEGLLNG